ncbi:hypothetical protein [Miltoncostaea marina]|uniref:hypothetical protein n=1 Tax=Miltoncostaea marina TaxID=2843215 RepID=UPI001C3DB68C|nr:hypothetical protein [Miltoncostaea marina]
MSAPRAPRRALASLGALVAAGAAGLLLVLGGGGGDQAVADARPAHHAGADVPARELDLRQDMRRLWEEHVTWTRMVIVDAAAAGPGLSESAARLLRNQADIGRAIVPWFGRAAGARLTTLLRGHILIAVDVLGAAKAGDAAALADARARWARNGDAIAGFLSSANPAAWPRAAMRSMMRRHLALTTAEAVARLSGDWRRDVLLYDAVHAQALHMADMLSDGIVQRFPDRFDR